MIIKRFIPVFCIGIIIALLCHMDGVGGNRAGEEIVTYGGKLSSRTISLLAELNGHIKSATDIIYAESGLIRLKDHENVIREYSLKDNILWADDDPILDGISFFHLEYRDRYGNLLTRPHHNINEIKVVGYTMKVSTNNQNVFTQYHTRRTLPSKVSSTQLAVASL